MGLYFRKSIRVGPLRFNLSKSGVGVSAGIRGFRVGTGPRGNYVHMGVGGLYYRSTLSPKSTPRSDADDLEAVEQPITHAPLERIGSGDLSRMVDSSSAALLSEMQQKARRLRTWPVVAGLGITMLGGLLAVHASAWIVWLVTVLFGLGTFAAYQFDLLSKTVVILYDLDSAMENAFERLHDCVQVLARCGGKWHIDARGQVYDPKYHGGAGQLVTRKRISIAAGQPAYIKSNIDVPYIALSQRTLYFFPERLLVFASTGVGAVSYGELSIVIDDKRFIEEESVPHDATVVDSTWRYVNKGGGPDRRFNNNRELPICNYEELWFNCPKGLNEVLQISRTGVGAKLDDAIQELADIVAKAAAEPAPVIVQPAAVPSGVGNNGSATATEERKQTAGPSHQTRPGSPFEALFEILCCLMVADGRVSSSEKQRIREVMAKVGSPWTDVEVNDLMAAFIDRVQHEGYRRSLANALRGTEVFKRVGKKDVLLRCLDIVASADEKLSDRELQLCKRVKALVE